MKRVALETSFHRSKSILRCDKRLYNCYIGKIKRLKGDLVCKLTHEYHARVENDEAVLNDYVLNDTPFRIGQSGSDDWLVYSKPDRPHRLLYVDQNGVEQAWITEARWPFHVEIGVFPLEDLSNPLLQTIFTYLKPVAMLLLARVSKRWYGLLRSNNPWVHWRDFTLAYMPTLQPIFEKHNKGERGNFQITLRKSQSAKKSWVTPRGIWHVFAKYLLIHNVDENVSFRYKRGQQNAPIGNTRNDTHMHTIYIKRILACPKSHILFDAISRVAICTNPLAFESSHSHTTPDQARIGPCFKGSDTTKTYRLHTCLHMTQALPATVPYVEVFKRELDPRLRIRTNDGKFFIHITSLLRNFLRIVRGHAPYRHNFKNNSVHKLVKDVSIWYNN